LRAGRNDYNKAINSTDTEELLLNIVRLRFNDKPYMLQISNISSRSEWYGQVEGGYDFSKVVRKGDSYEVRRSPSVGGALRYTEKPSIIYQPLRGTRFVQQLLSPLDLETIFLLRFAGFEMNNTLRVFARAINNVPNAPTGGDSTPTGVPVYKNFMEGVNALGELEDRGALIYALVKKKNKWDTETVAIKVLPRARNSEAFATLTRTFNLDPEADQYRMKIGWVPGRQNEIIIETRPILSAMFFLGRNIEIPESLQNSGVVHFNLDENNQPFDWSKVLRGLFNIRSATRKPSGAYTAVKYRGHYYYIDDTDIPSKETLTMLNIVFTLRAGGSPAEAPVLTLPVE
jgi:hypothetical protein